MEQIEICVISIRCHQTYCLNIEFHNPEIAGIQPSQLPSVPFSSRIWTGSDTIAHRPNERSSPQLKIVYVYLGNPLPKYLRMNLEYSVSQFGYESVVLISDIESNLSWASTKGYEIWKCPNYLLDSKGFDSKSDLDIVFRNGFWFHTYSRFFALADFMRTTGESILHVEGDVLLLPNFPLDLFSNLTKIAFPLENETIGVASTLFLPDAKSAEFLCNFTRVFIESNTSATDMHILGALSQQHSERVEVLPTARDSASFFLEGTPSSTRELLSGNWSKYRGIFDGAVYGQYLGGLDPANYLGIRRVFAVVPRDGVVAPQNLTFRYEGNSVNIFHNELTSPVYSLHLHSKDIRLFSTDGFQKVMSNRMRKQFEGEYLEFTSLSSIILRVFLKLKIHIYRKIESLLRKSQNRLLGAILMGSVLISSRMFGIRIIRPKIREFTSLGQASNPLQDSNLPAINIVIPCHVKDFSKLNIVIEGAKRNVLNPIGELYLVTPEEFTTELSLRFPDCRVLADEAVLGDTILRGLKKTVPLNRQGWVLQQLVKFRVSMFTNSIGALVIDADTVLLKPKVWIDSKGQQILCISNEWNTRYKAHQKNFLNSENCLFGFVTHHQFMQRGILLDYFGEEDEELLRWMSTGDFTEMSAVSEYDTYGEILFHDRRRKFRYSKWNNCNSELDFTNFTYDNLLKIYSDYDSVSAHTYLAKL